MENYQTYDLTPQTLLECFSQEVNLIRQGTPDLKIDPNDYDDNPQHQARYLSKRFKFSRRSCANLVIPPSFPFANNWGDLVSSPCQFAKKVNFPNWRTGRNANLDVDVSKIAFFIDENGQIVRICVYAAFPERNFAPSGKPLNALIVFIVE